MVYAQGATVERYQVELKDFPGDQKIFVRVFRIVGRISLSDAVKVYVQASNSTRTVLTAGIEKHVADHIAQSFAEAHIDVVVKDSSISTPMICRPQANATYRWSSTRNVIDV